MLMMDESKWKMFVVKKRRISKLDKELILVRAMIKKFKGRETAYIGIKISPRLLKEANIKHDRVNAYFNQSNNSVIAIKESPDGAYKLNKSCQNSTFLHFNIWASDDIERFKMLYKLDQHVVPQLFIYDGWIACDLDKLKAKPENQQFF